MKMSMSLGTGFSLGAVQKDMTAKLTRAAAVVTDRAATGARDGIRAAMRGQRLGNLANAIKQTSDLKKRRVHLTGDGGWSVSGIVYAHIKSPRTAGALQAYSQGASILPRKGRWLAIGTNEIPSRVGRRRMTPELYRKGGYESKIGPLVFIPTAKPSVAMLVVKNVSTNLNRRGSARRLPKSGRVRSGRENVSIIAFILIRATQRAKRFDPAAIVAKWQGRVPQMMQAEILG